MFKKYDTDPVIDLYNSLHEAIGKYYNEEYDYFDEEDLLTELILMNNAVKKTKDSMKFKTVEIIKDSIYVCFIMGAEANEINRFFDICDFYGAKYLFVFVDYFKGLAPADEESIMANSVYFDAIETIVIHFYKLLIIDTKGTISSTNISYNSYYIAGKIIFDTVGTLVQSDAEMIDIDVLRSYIKCPSGLFLVGVRQNTF